MTQQAPRSIRTTSRLMRADSARAMVGGHGTRCSAAIVTARDMEGDDQRRADAARPATSCSARKRRRRPSRRGARASAAARRRPPRRGARVRDLHAALGLDAAARAARQPLADPLAARAAPALRLGHFDKKWSERSMTEFGLDTKRRRAPAVGPAAAPRAGRQRQVDHRRQDAQQRLHRRPPARVLARRALHLPAAPPGGDRALAAAPCAGEHADERREERRPDPPLLRGARAGAPDLPRAHGPLRGPDRRAGARDCARSARSSASRGSRACSSTASSTTAATRSASATGPRRSRRARSSRPSRRRRSRTSRPRCAR